MKSKSPKLPLRFAWIWILAIVLLFMAVKPAYRLVKHWRSQMILSDAHQLMGKGDLVRAYDKCLVSLQLDPFQGGAYRILAQISDLRNEASSVTLWFKVIQSGEATDADRQALGEAAIRDGLFALVDQQLNILLSRPTSSREAYHLAGLLAVRQQKPSLAREWFQKALLADPRYTRAEVNLARVEVLFGETGEIQDRGIARLRALASQENEWGLESLRVLAEYGTSHPGVLPFDPKIADQMRNHSAAKMTDRCLMVDWELTTNPKKGKELLDGITAGASKLTDIGRRDLAVWMNRHRWYAKTLEVFPMDRNAPEDLMLVQLDAMAALGQWTKINDFLSQDVLIKQPILRSLYRARTSKELGNQRLFEIGWRQAVRESEKNPKALIYLAEYAEKIGETARCAEVLEILSQQKEVQLEALLRLVRTYERLGQTKELFGTIKRIHLLRTSDSAVNNDMAYLGLLLGDMSAKPHEGALEVYSTNQRLPAFAVTYALSQLQKGAPAEALRVLQTFRVSELTAPGWQAVYAATLAANGKKKEALRVAERITVRDLKPEEKKLLSGFGFPVK